MRMLNMHALYGANRYRSARSNGFMCQRCISNAFVNIFSAAEALQVAFHGSKTYNYILSCFCNLIATPIKRYMVTVDMLMT